MKRIIPYTKEISFSSKIAEITTMSLEHEYELEPGSLNGNFIISGDYKTHEVSINREPFLYKLPFTMDLTDGIDENSFQFEITNFSYHVISENTVEVHIEFSVEVEEKSSIFEKVELEEIDDLTDLIEEPIEDRFLNKKTEVPEVVEPIKEVIREDMLTSEDTIIKNVNPMDETYATYHIHIVKENENVETICTLYHSNLNLLNDYNDMSNVSVGDKLIIPKEDE